MTNTKTIVMSRVRAIHTMRPFVSTGALCVVLVVASVYAVSRAVWVEMVFRNMPSVTDVTAFINFFAYAFIHTGVAVQAFSIVALLAAGFLIRESLRAVTVLAPSRA